MLKILTFIIFLYKWNLVEYLPLFVDLKNRPVLVVGGGSVAVRKIRILQSTGAIITIIARSICPELKEIVPNHNIKWISENFEPTMLDKVILVIVATNDSELNDFIYQNAEKRYILINTVDDKKKCSCIFPAIIDRDPVIIGISSCGTAPILVRILREKLELLLPKSVGYIAKFAGMWRDQVKRHIVDTVCRRRFWEKIFYNGHITALLEQERPKEAVKVFKRVLNTGNYNNKKGHVTLVGAGPGDVGLLTIRGLQVIQQADVVLYDHLVNTDILNLARRDSDKIYVGKRVGDHSISQKELNQFIVQLAKQGKKVVRLKGGDPFIFGRGGEELQAVIKAGDISFQVVPGITAGIGATAYAGIPLTHRQYAHSVTFITGHNINNNNYQFDWNALSHTQQTLVIYMGKLNAKNISKNLIAHGRSIHTPVAVISHGTCQNQRNLIGTLIELETLVQTVDYPVLLVIGDVVSLHNQINWFGQKPMYYYRINSTIRLM